MKNNIFYSILFSISLWACSSSPDKKIEEEKTSVSNIVELPNDVLKNANITLVPMSKGQGSNIHKASGMVEVPPQNLSVIHVPLGGYLKSTILLSGLHVKKGQVLATVEDVQYIQLQQDYLQNKSEMQFAQAEYNRQKVSFENQATSTKALQEAKMTVETKEINTNALAEKLEMIGINPATLSASTIKKSISIVAPFDGFVSKVNAKMGQYYAPTDDLGELINSSDLHLVVTVFEKDLANFKIGKKVMAYSNENPTLKYQATVLQINNDISADRTAEIHCHFAQNYSTVHSGMFLNVDFEGKMSNSFSASPESIVRAENVSYVFVPETANRFRAEPITILTENDAQVIFTFNNNINPERIVKSGANALLMEMKKE
jgi:membrane fusion protein, heavy metal efflux system